MRTLATLENRVYRQMLTNPCRHHLTLEDVAAAALTTHRTLQTLPVKR